MANLTEQNEKLVQIVLFVLNMYEHKTCDFMKVFKIIYFAEKEHLARYGRSISGDSFIAMQYGPVPSKISNILNEVRSDYKEISPYNAYFDVVQYISTAKCNADLDYLSESEIECLEESFEKYHNYSFSQLSTCSHDSAYNLANPNGKIKTIAIAQSAGANDEMLKYIQRNLEIENTISWLTT